MRIYKKASCIGAHHKTQSTHIFASRRLPSPRFANCGLWLISRQQRRPHSAFLAHFQCKHALPQCLPPCHCLLCDLLRRHHLSLSLPLRNFRLQILLKPQRVLTRWYPACCTIHAKGTPGSRLTARQAVVQRTTQTTAFRWAVVTCVAASATSRYLEEVPVLAAISPCRAPKVCTHVLWSLN